MTPPRAGRLDDISILRVFVTLWVVLYHVLCPYGNIWAAVPFVPTPGMSEVMNAMQFHMPLFFFLSGFLFSYLVREKGKYRQYGPFVWNKFKRLMIPYFVFGTLIIVTGTRLDGSRELPDLVRGVDHLWFLPSLFACFAVSGGLLHTRKAWLQLAGVLVVLAASKFLYSHRVALFSLGTLYPFFIWFVLGYVYQACRGRRWVEKLKGNAALAGLFVLYLLFFLAGYRLGMQPVRLVGYGMVVLFLWGLTDRLLAAGKIRVTKAVQRFDRRSYGIFIFHHWFISAALQLPWVLAFADTHRVLYPLVCFPLAVAVSYALTSLLLLTRPGRFLLG